ncbi:hypothetical protein ASPZODRAFT_1445088 [Penicilliopsis zonata CBS 506.65]|uniref:Uncharacterized protein n=1 Tax=Penicilliopsis zonata CBS 506.65 TaxID=1073090 RepID=A0A1L9SQB7_9EURO|nr:hypothetical protein ASPZODRAFT_1445088 [Penicilliopsis zonata CBS 506.65]OJJ49287.1 hypothetical protein ASPZODRAFT_1445088 [Penicilliopsis zonata CBS 506.65]
MMSNSAAVSAAAGSTTIAVSAITNPVSTGNMMRSPRKRLPLTDLPSPSRSKKLARLEQSLFDPNYEPSDSEGSDIDHNVSPGRCNHKSLNSNRVEPNSFQKPVARTTANEGIATKPASVVTLNPGEAFLRNLKSKETPKERPQEKETVLPIATDHSSDNVSSNSQANCSIPKTTGGLSVVEPLPALDRNDIAFATKTMTTCLQAMLRYTDAQTLAQKTDEQLKISEAEIHNLRQQLNSKDEELKKKDGELEKKGEEIKLRDQEWERRIQVINQRLNDSLNARREQDAELLKLKNTHDKLQQDYKKVRLQQLQTGSERPVPCPECTNKDAHMASTFKTQGSIIQEIKSKLTHTKRMIEDTETLTSGYVSEIRWKIEGFYDKYNTITANSSQIGDKVEELIKTMESPPGTKQKTWI